MSIFKKLSKQLTTAISHLKPEKTITDESLKPILHEIRRSMIDADVALIVIDKLLLTMTQKLIGQVVPKGIAPQQFVGKIIHDSIIEILTVTDATQLNITKKHPAVIVLSGLQGSGKTTTATKLALWIQKQYQYRVRLTSCDIYRPAAIDQLEQLCQTHDLDFTQGARDNINTIIDEAIKATKAHDNEVLIIDTAGRMHVDQDMLDELKNIHKRARPSESLLVLDGMIGQHAFDIVGEFHEAVSLTGLIMTKLDGTHKGGAALSAFEVCQKPIRFMGTGEKADDFELFDPKRIADQLLDLGDIESLLANMEEKVDKEKAEKTTKKMLKGRFDFEDYLNMLEQLKDMGGMKAVLSKLPGANQLSEQIENAMDPKFFTRTEAIIHSMTLKERRHVFLLNQNSRIKRISKGSGTHDKDVKQLLKQHQKMSKMMKKFKGGMMNKMMEKMSGGSMPKWPPPE